jgi:hypothetical protein
VLEEANAIGSPANFALMLPEPARNLLRAYTAVRAALSIPYDPAKLERDVARTLEFQNQLWQQAIAVTASAPQSMPVYRFVASLNEMNNIHERRLTALHYHIPGALTFLLIAVAVVATGFAGYHDGARGSRGRAATLVMSLTIAVLVIDLDRPARGLIQVPVQPLIDAQQGIRS